MAFLVEPLSPPRLAPLGEIDQRLLVSGGIKPENAAAGLHLFGDEILERGHLEGLVGDFLGKLGRNHDHAVAVAEDDVAGKYRRVATADRTVDLDRLMQLRLGGG